MCEICCSVHSHNGSLKRRLQRFLTTNLQRTILGVSVFSLQVGAYPADLALLDDHAWSIQVK
jgi:hypothetical protein